MVEHGLTQGCGKADARLRREELRGKAAPHADGGHQQQNQKANDDILPVAGRHADVDHLRHNQRHKQVEHDLQQFEERREHAFLLILLQINCKTSHVSDSILFS